MIIDTLTAVDEHALQKLLQYREAYEGLSDTQLNDLKTNLILASHHIEECRASLRGALLIDPR